MKIFMSETVERGNADDIDRNHDYTLRYPTYYKRPSGSPPRDKVKPSIVIETVYNLNVIT